MRVIHTHSVEKDCPTARRGRAISPKHLDRPGLHNYKHNRSLREYNEGQDMLLSLLHLKENFINIVSIIHVLLWDRILPIGMSCVVGILTVEKLKLEYNHGDCMWFMTNCWTFNWGWLTVQKFSPLFSQQETRWHTGRQAWCWRSSLEFYIFRQQDERVTLGLVSIWNFKACPRDTPLPRRRLYLLHQGHTSQ